MARHFRRGGAEAPPGAAPSARGCVRAGPARCQSRPTARGRSPSPSRSLSQRREGLCEPRAGTGAASAGLRLRAGECPQCPWRGGAFGPSHGAGGRAVPSRCSGPCPTAAPGQSLSSPLTPPGPAAPLAPGLGLTLAPMVCPRLFPVFVFPVQPPCHGADSPGGDSPGQTPGVGTALPAGHDFPLRSFHKAPQLLWAEVLWENQRFGLFTCCRRTEEPWARWARLLEGRECCPRCLSQGAPALLRAAGCSAAGAAYPAQNEPFLWRARPLVLPLGFP